jgi:hypothetical protein
MTGDCDAVSELKREYVRPPKNGSVTTPRVAN